MLGVLNSQFFSSLMGALFGALAGATAAHRIAQKSKEKENLLEQLRSTNSALMSSYMICNAYLLLKDQQVKDLYLTFSKKREEYEKIISGEAKSPTFEYQADFIRVVLPKIPLNILNEQVYRKLNLNGRPVAATAQIDNTIASLESVIDTRDFVIQSFRESPEMDAEMKANLYFGFPLPGGATNTEYADALRGIATYVDDVIFFSKLLCDDLAEHGQKTRLRLQEKYGEEPPKVNKVDLSGAEDKGLIPDLEQYSEWIEGYKTLEPNEETGNWLSRILKKVHNQSQKVDA